jgi:3-oxoacyl-[acyl-carrier protein] reductase
LVQAFVEAGDQVMATYRTSPLPTSDRATAVHLDLLDAASRAAFAARVAALPQAIDVLVLLPGVIAGLSLADYSEGKIDEVISTNFTSQAILLKALLPMLSVGAHVLLMGSISGERGSFDPIYAASKGAIIAFGKSLAVSLAPRVRVNVLAPSLIEGSSMWQSMPEERRERHRRASPTGRLVDKNDLAKIIVDVTQPHWSAVNGVVIRINGGSNV